MWLEESEGEGSGVGGRGTQQQDPMVSPSPSWSWMLGFGTCSLEGTFCPVGSWGAGPAPPTPSEASLSPLPSHTVHGAQRPL